MSRFDRALSGFLTVGGRFDLEDSDYIRVTLINVIGLVGGLIWGAFLLRNTWLWVEGGLGPGRVLVDAFGTAVCVGMVVALRLRVPVDRVAGVANAGSAFAVVGLVALRDQAGTALMVAAMYPPLAFFLLDELRRAGIWTIVVTALLCAVVAAGRGPDAPVPGEVIPTVVVVMLTEMAVMAVYVGSRRRMLHQLAEARERLTEESIHDALTGLHNRRTFDEFLDRCLARVRRGGTGLAMLMVDIDHFKAFNDTYGHPAGDEALHAVAGVLERTFARREDLVFRLGGEEFGVVYFCDTRAKAQTLAASAEGAIEGLGLSSPGGPRPRLTLSGGLAWVPASTRTDAVTVYREADQALYRAKAEGRARCVTIEAASVAVPQ